MPVDAWMSACLADPDHGYYVTRDPLGRAGDFITAPEISQMFGELIGLWSAVVWQQMGAPASFNFVELGPGRGTLMADMLRAASGLPGVADAVHVHLVETSPVLKKRQQEVLASAPGAPSWHADLVDLPAGPTIVIANEFLDALPVRQLVKCEAGWCERCVDWTGSAFEFVTGGRVTDTDVPAPLRDAAVGSIVEVSPAVTSAVTSVAARIVAHGGAALFIDYGYTAAAVSETLQAVRGHDYADPLADAGACDLTAHVDFGAVAGAAEARGARAWGPLAQGTLLESLGIAERAAALMARATLAQVQDIAAARTRLVADDGMGRLFKALAITDQRLPAPPGFAIF